MNIQKIKSRGVLFTFNSSSDWEINVYLIIGRRNNYIIDTGLGSLCIKQIKEYLKNDNKPMIVINTHYHWDHVWGNNSLKECTIISHKLCRELLEANWKEMMERNGLYCQGEISICLPNLVFENELYFPEDRIRIVHTPGHTADSVSVIDEEDKIIHVGDNIGDTVEEIIPSIYCKKELYFNTIQKYKEVDFDKCISGHNVVLGKEVTDRILRILKEGDSSHEHFSVC